MGQKPQIGKTFYTNW